MQCDDVWPYRAGGDGTGGNNFVFADSGTAAGNQLYRFYGDVTGDRFVNGADYIVDGGRTAGS